MDTRKHILCYGDSNTWGCIGKWVENDIPSERFDPEHRWPTVLQKELGDRFHIVEEGLGGRTTIYTRPGEEWKSGLSCFKACLHSHRPLELVIIMLGTNDLHVNLDLTEETLGDGIRQFFPILREKPCAGPNNTPPKVLLIAPPEVCPSAPEGRTHVYAKFREETGRRLSLAFPTVYEKIAKEQGCWFFNSQCCTHPGPADGVHIDAGSHMALGKELAVYIREHIFKEEL